MFVSSQNSRSAHERSVSHRIRRPFGNPHSASSYTDDVAVNRCFTASKRSRAIINSWSRRSVHIFDHICSKGSFSSRTISVFVMFSMRLRTYSGFAGSYLPLTNSVNDMLSFLRTISTSMSLISSTGRQVRSGVFLFRRRMMPHERTGSRHSRKGCPRCPQLLQNMFID